MKGTKKTKKDSKKVEQQAPEKEVNPKIEDVENGGKNGNGKENHKEAPKPDKVAVLEAEVAELKDNHVRLMAEFDNFRKRTRKEKQDLLKYSSEEIMTALLPVLDDFERTLIAMDKTDNLDSIKNGINLVSQNMSRILNKEGLKPMETMGEEFNTEFHEAVTTIPVDAEEQKGKVIDEIEKGYLLIDKVIRYAKVVVGE